ncbi:LysR family transcriptional regulator, partial [Klebsiella pneumoniae]|nr:LysR family transcriptional regulator [Klebsiella pneumoniae]
MADFPPVASLRSFEAVARLGSVTQAAHELSVTHSAVSQHIKQLEALVGVTLFIRHGRGVRITEEGRLYALQIREALQHIADATRMVQIKPRTLEVTLATLPSFGCHWLKPRTLEVTLATLPSFGCHWLLPRLARFQTRHPQIAVRLLTSLAVVNLQQEGIDLAIRMGQGDWEGMESRHLFADEQLVVAAPGYRGGNLPTTPQAIAASDIIFSMESWNAW